MLGEVVPDMTGRDSTKVELPLLTPGQEALHGPGVGRAGMRIADRRLEELVPGELPRRSQIGDEGREVRLLDFDRDGRLDNGDQIPSGGGFRHGFSVPWPGRE